MRKEIVNNLCGYAIPGRLDKKRTKPFSKALMRQVRSRKAKDDDFFWEKLVNIEA
jgi:hypothetical protein